MTTLGVAVAETTGVPAMPPAVDCEDGHQGCDGDTQVPDDYDTTMGKALIFKGNQANSLTSILVS